MTLAHNTPAIKKPILQMKKQARSHDSWAMSWRLHLQPNGSLWGNSAEVHEAGGSWTLCDQVLPLA